ncbi:pectinesterase inhibitor 8-like [Oryza glaberrima]|uniref:Pectinesterase inhibitor domain-containing protein n=1 Tax=Oryza glaberrima TaxID=4538 RepID=I1PSG6_ORYGL|nr:pectinesterase inhibitor 8-like [Oryza glaberrima]
MKASSLAAVAAAVLVAAACSGRAPVAEATIESTCGAAAKGDRRVDVGFCARQFASYHGAAEADAWGLAKIAALIGVNLADDAVFDIGAGKIRPSPGGGAKGDKAMDACAKAYDAVGVAFAEAADELGSRRYAAARQELARVAALVQRCDGGLSRAGARSPLPRYSADCQQVAIIGIAFTSLLK